MELDTKTYFFSPLTDIVSKCNFRVVMLIRIYLPFALGLNIVKYVNEKISCVPIHVTIFLEKSQFENLTLNSICQHILKLCNI